MSSGILLRPPEAKTQLKIGDILGFATLFMNDDVLENICEVLLKTRACATLVSRDQN